MTDNGDFQFDPEASLVRYARLQAERPELFKARPSGSIELVTDREGIAQAQREARSHYQRNGWPTDDLRVGVLTGGPFSSFMRDAVRFPDGRLGLYHRILAPLGVVILPLLGDEIVLLRIFRHPLGTWVLETPRGICEQGAGFPETARRELTEETGAVANDLIDLGRINTTSGLSSEYLNLFFARIDDFGQPDRSEGISRIETVPVSELDDAICDGRICDAPTIAAIARARAGGLLDQPGQ